MQYGFVFLCLNPLARIRCLLNNIVSITQQLFQLVS